MKIKFKKENVGIMIAVVVTFLVFVGLFTSLKNISKTVSEREYIPITVTITHADITAKGARVLSFTSEEYSDSLSVSREIYAKHAVGDEMIVWKYVNGLGQTEYCLTKPN